MRIATGSQYNFRLALPFIVGFWSLAGQFVLNRIIFFYVANSEYAAATIISLHLSGFLAGSLLARHSQCSIAPLIGASLFTVALAQLGAWTLGIVVFGFWQTLTCAIVSAFMLAFFSGALLTRMIQKAEKTSSSVGVVIADTAGSVMGAIIGGFMLVPVFGLQASFIAIMGLHLAGLLLSVTRPKLIVTLGAACLIISLQSVPSPRASEHPRIDNLPMAMASEDLELIFRKNSPYGWVSVGDAEGLYVLSIDNRALCKVRHNDHPFESASEWVVGARAASSVKSGDAPRIANIGLGCGTTLSAILQHVPADAIVDTIEINPAIPETQSFFNPYQRFPSSDPRVNILIDDGYTYFADGAVPHLYDAVVIDIAWMHNMNATHLFSEEMYRNVRALLKEGGIVAIWSEELSPFSPVARIMHKTLRAVFPTVAIDASQDTVLFYAGDARADVSLLVPDHQRPVASWLEHSSADVPVNRLDDLAMNRAKFSLTGNSNYDDLQSWYGRLSKR